MESPTRGQLISLTHPFELKRLEIQQVALSIVDKPYRRKGHGPHSFDCAGAIYYCCEQSGLNADIPAHYSDSARDETLLRELFSQTKRQMAISEGRAGDLALMRIPTVNGGAAKGSPLNYSHHCGILVKKDGKMHMVHAHLPSKRVRIDRIADLQEPLTAVFSVTD